MFDVLVVMVVCKLTYTCNHTKKRQFKSPSRPAHNHTIVFGDVVM